MRPSLMLALAILVATAATPTALAAPSQVVLALPDGELAHDAVVPVNVTLTIQDFMCHEPRTFSVTLFANSTAGVKGTFARTALTFTTDARSYFAEDYTQTQTVNLTVRALQAGEVELTAHFPEHEVGPCLVPDGFAPSTSTVVARVKAPPSAGNATDANETNATPTPTPRVSPTPNGGARPTVCAPDTTCGYIGEFDEQESAGGNDTPGAGLVGAALALTVAAFVARRRKA
ncbi:MAG TPA: hypothetical protein VFH78_01195 [Candidatus Thermoplasmatota archaeon]|nr:hypothetical protein [Candidatus Thermoplasmatota archaeon]